MITASVVLYNNTPVQIENVLQSIERSPIDKVYVIDHSTDESALPVVNKFPKAEYIKHPNEGYGKGNNHGIKKALAEGARYHVVINPDIYWTENVIEQLRDYMDANPDTGLIMPQLKLPDGNLLYACKLLPTPLDLIFRRFMPIKGFVRKNEYNYSLRWSGYDEIMEIPCLSGCFMFMRCTVLEKLGGFDERYFLYAEDIDLSRQIGDLSKTIFYPHVNIIHESNEASHRSLKYFVIHACSLIKYFTKWGWIWDKTRRERNKATIEKLKIQKSIS